LSRARLDGERGWIKSFIQSVFFFLGPPAVGLARNRARRRYYLLKSRILALSLFA